MRNKSELREYFYFLRVMNTIKIRNILTININSVFRVKKEQEYIEIVYRKSL